MAASSLLPRSSICICGSFDCDGASVCVNSGSELSRLIEGSVIVAGIDRRAAIAVAALKVHFL